MPDSSHPSLFETVLYQKSGAIARITLNRPDVLNALSRQTIADLRAAFEDAKDDPEISGVVLTGSGDRAFIAGADIAELAKSGPLEAKQHTTEGQALFSLVENLGKPVIAAVNGVAFGGGCEAAMACTIRLAVPDAKFGQPEVKLGLVPGFGGTQRLPRLVGKGRALQMILTGDPIPATEALRIGLVNELVAPADLLARAEAILDRIAANGPLAVKFAAEAVERGLEGPLAEGLALESALFSLCTASDDAREGISAFLGKRKPVFAGK